MFFSKFRSLQVVVTNHTHTTQLRLSYTDERLKGSILVHVPRQRLHYHEARFSISKSSSERAIQIKVSITTKLISQIIPMMRLKLA